jgi:hypothetical protein
MKRTVKTKESRQIEESLLIEGEESIDDVIEEILASDLPEEEEEEEEEESEMDSEEEQEGESEEQEGEEDNSCMYNSDDEESDYDSEEEESQLDEMPASLAYQQNVAKSKVELGDLLKKHGFERDELYHHMNYVGGGQASKSREEYVKMDKDDNEIARIRVEHGKGTFGVGKAAKSTNELKRYLEINHPAGMKESQLESRDMARLIESEEGLTEEFKSKAALIFESEVALRVSEIRESLESKYEQKLEENVEKISEHLTLQIDEYLTYAVDQWIESNQVAIESSLRTDIAEGFMNSLKTLFTENYVEVPESKVDLYNELEQKAGSLEQSLKTTKKLAESLQEKVKTLSREKIIAEESKGLAETQSAKLLKLSESVEFQNEKDFAKKLKTLKEFYFKSEDKTLMDPINEESDIDVTFETIVEGLEEQKGEPAVPKEMKRYLETLTRLHKSSI